MQGHGKLWNLDNFAAVKPRNFANSPAKFGKKLLQKTVGPNNQYSTRSLSNKLPIC